MPPVKPLDAISEKWSRQSNTAQPEYIAGIENPRRSWAAATSAAASSWAQGVQDAIANNSFSDGVKQVGDQAWQDAARSKGPSRWAEGIRLSKAKYEAGFAPYREVLQQLNLPERGPKGSPENLERVRLVMMALHERKIALRKRRRG